MRTKTKTKVERLMIALYKTHHAALRGSVSRLVGTGYADDAIGHLAEKLCAKPDLWDGNDSKMFSFLHSALKRLAFNRLRDERKHLHECDSAATEMGATEWKVWTDPSCSPEVIALTSISREQMRAAVVCLEQSGQWSVCPYDELFDLLADEYGGKEIAERLQININTAHGAIRRVRLKIEQYNQERPEGARGA
jgi:DNA-directed RNA polymerase specialized sigma24 family protein